MVWGMWWQPEDGLRAAQRQSQLLVARSWWWPGSERCTEMYWRKDPLGSRWGALWHTSCDWAAQSAISLCFPRKTPQSCYHNASWSPLVHSHTQNGSSTASLILSAHTQHGSPPSHRVGPSVPSSKMAATNFNQYGLETLPPPFPFSKMAAKRAHAPPSAGDCQVARSRGGRGRVAGGPGRGGPGRGDRDGDGRDGAKRAGTGRDGSSRDGSSRASPSPCGSALRLASARLQLGPGSPWGRCRSASNGHLRAGRRQRAGQAVRRHRRGQRRRGECCPGTLAGGDGGDRREAAEPGVGGPRCSRCLWYGVRRGGGLRESRSDAAEGLRFACDKAASLFSKLSSLKCIRVAGA